MLLSLKIPVQSTHLDEECQLVSLGDGEQTMPPVISEKSSAPVLILSNLDVNGTHLSKIKDVLENAFCIRFVSKNVLIRQK